MCPPLPSASNGAVCSDLVAGSTTMIIAVANGNFETPYVANYQAAPGGASWNWGPGSGIQRYYSAYGAYPSSDLWQTAYIQGAGSFAQTINLSPGSYRVSFQAARRPYSVPAGTFQPIVVSVDGVALGSPVVPTIDFQFNTFAFGFSITTGGPHTIKFSGTDGSGDKTSFIDLVSITSGMSLLEDAIIKFDDGQALPDSFPEWVVRFFQEFADRCHHAKEEDVFFPVLKQRGIPEQGGPIGVMLHEHVLGRDCVSRMREASQTKPFDSQKFAEAAKQYVPLLHEHIFKENNVLFRVAEQVMSEADDAAVTSRFSQVEQERGLSDQHAIYTNQVSQWEKSFR
jgi:hemerythrin-like domain-containing protein